MSAKASKSNPRPAVFPIGFNTHIFSNQAGKWTLSMQVNGMPLNFHQRCTRTYATPQAAATSSRHLIKELFREDGQ